MSVNNKFAFSTYAKQMETMAISTDYHAPLTASAGLSSLADMSIDTPSTRTPGTKVEDNIEEDLGSYATEDDNEDDGDVVRLTDEDMLDLFGPPPPSEPASTPSSSSSTSSPSSSSSSSASSSFPTPSPILTPTPFTAPSSYANNRRLRPARKLPTPVGFSLTTNDRYLNPPRSAIHPNPRTPSTGVHALYDADTERVRRASRSTAAVQRTGNVFDHGPCPMISPLPGSGSCFGSGSDRGRATSRSIATSPSSSRSQSRTRRRRNQSIHEILATPGATSPFFVGTVPSIMAASPSALTAAGRDSIRMPPPPHPSRARRPSFSAKCT
ncbi:MAG: hypothetical protein STHCBS139747_004156 [Sporothrix thermara]